MATCAVNQLTTAVGMFADHSIYPYRFHHGLGRNALLPPESVARPMLSSTGCFPTAARIPRIDPIS